MTTVTIENKARKAWMSLLAKAPPARLKELWDISSFSALKAELLRAPEAGAMMVQGRMGGTGAAFNLGEMTVTRCTLKLSCGTTGHSMVQGRDKQHARIAAIADALMQTDQATDVQDEILGHLAAEAGAQAAMRAAKAAGTKVEFFTMVRGED
ncbi:phosphonate C-P lyase system protein PhnG [Thalassobius sp. I31.1]|uniref:phosphonate C-P lyase system protein PhnG n=1 Tax=Thalassobius sp. I31.1 TaxID=2109912 RepID=UPI000D1A0F90|nr:phosphonate C-P lyase system protein PhnG [Thalassobius sp. I31.1]